MTLARKLKILMAFYDRSNKEVAAELGISKQRLSNYLSGLHRPPLEILKKIADIFNISLDFLVNDRFELHIVYRNEYNHELPAVAESKTHYKVPDEISDLLTDLDEKQKKIILQLIKILKGEK